MVTATGAPLYTAAPLAACSAVVCPASTLATRSSRREPRLGYFNSPLSGMAGAWSSPPVPPLRGMDAAWLSPLVPPLRGMDSEVSFESLTVAWISPVLSDVALDVRGGVGVAASPGVWTMPSATGVPVDTRGAGVTGADAEAQARESNNNNPAKPNCGALTARFQASRMTSGSLSCWLSSSILYPPA